MEQLAEPAQSPMTTIEFLDWATAQPEGARYELSGGRVVAMAPERNLHNLTKQEAWLTLKNAARDANLPCTVLGDGATVIVDETTAYEPDVSMQCGEDIDLDAVTIPFPIVLVEVLSASTGGVDTGQKLADYFRIDSLRHYLILRPETRSVIHHARQDGGEITTSVLANGEINLDPPGFSVAVEDLFV